LKRKKEELKASQKDLEIKRDENAQGWKGERKWWKESEQKVVSNLHNKTLRQ
jgi:hypothetical protein